MSTTAPALAGMPRIGRRTVALVLALTLALLGVLAAAPSVPAVATPPGPPDVARYLGRWNYDQPDRATMRNIAIRQCPAAQPACPSLVPSAPPGSDLQIPQIGYIVFTRGPGATVVGQTDQGCTWRFSVHPDGLELDPGAQYCFNHVISSGYTLTRWSVRVSGPYETEMVVGISRHPNADYDFVLQRGSRTRVGREPTGNRLFAGAWRYDPAQPQSYINIAALVSTS